MKKLMISFLAGAVLIGTGLGITFLELSDWSASDYPAYLDTAESRLYETEEPVIMNEQEKIDTINISLNTMYRNEFRKIDMVEVVKDPSYKDSVKIEIMYKGNEPDIYTYTYETSSEPVDYGTADSEEAETRLEGHIVVYTDQYDSIAEYKQVIQAMFNEKTIYRNMNNCLIESVTVRTAYPEIIKIR